MHSGKTAIERAFELAQSGEVGCLTDVVRKLKAEGYGTDQITGRTLRSQLRGIIAASRHEAAPPGAAER